MGTYTYAKLEEYLKFRMAQRSDLETVNSATNLYKVWINAAYKELTQQDKFWGLKMDFDFPELKADNSGTDTSDGVAYISVPSDLYATISLWDSTSDRWLNPIGWRSYLKKKNRANTDAENAPKRWVRSGAYYYLYPTPDDTYSIYVYYRKRVTALSASTDVTAIGEEWDEAILELASYKMHRWCKEYEFAKDAQEAFMMVVAGVVGTSKFDQIGRKARVKPSATMMNSYKRGNR